MAKVKVCLDSICSKYYQLDDGRAVHVPKDKCDIEHARKNPSSYVDFKLQFNDMMRGVRKVVTMSDDPHWKKGDEATF